MAPKPKDERTAEETCTASKKDGEPCMAYPLEGRDKCRVHAGTSSDGSSHEDNGYAITHGVTADPLNLYTHLDSDAKEWVDALADGYYDILGYDENDPRRERVVRACVHIYQANSGEGQILEDGLTETQTIGVSDESGAPVVRDDEHHLNKTVLKRDKEARQILRTLGAFDDPESQKAEATKSLAKLLSEE